MNDALFSIQAGFIPLNDAAILIIAKECGFAAKEGIDLHLHRETSWATLRDKLAIGLFDAAHLLAPMPVADVCGLFPLSLDIVTPMALGVGGNMVTMSRSVWEEHWGASTKGEFEAMIAGRRLRTMIEERKAKDMPVLKFGVVHPYSAHNYELRYWLAGCSIDPDLDVEIVILPPSMMPAALQAGAIDAYCVGEPWSSVAIKQGYGVLLTTKAHIWQSSPEKVLGVRQAFTIEQPEAHLALLRALYRAAYFIEQPGNIPQICDILSRPTYLGLPPNQLKAGFSGTLDTGFPEKSRLHMSDFYLSCSRAAIFPWASHALWFYSQMIRWGHATWSERLVRKITSICAPDYLRQALEPMQVALPDFNMKIEGSLDHPAVISVSSGELQIGPDRFFDGGLFNPEHMDHYYRH